MASVIGYHYDTGNPEIDREFTQLHNMILEAGHDIHHVVGFQAVEHNPITYTVLYEVYYTDTRGADKIWLNRVG